jgi:predicted DNA-binding transcriptional regulator YafY
MARGEQILRHWNLLKTLQTRGEGIPLRQLAEEFEVSERTIQRDFEMLQDLGFPVEHQEDEYGKRYWWMPHDFFRTGPLVLSLTEAVSLHLAERMFGSLEGTHLAEGWQTALEKIRSIVPQKALEHFAELDGIIHVRRTGTTDYGPHAEVVRTLVDAVLGERTVEITYRSLWRGDEYTTRVDPYGLVLYDGDLFLVGRSHRADASRIFKVPRVRQAVVCSERFQRPDGFCLEEQFHNSFGIFQATGKPTEIVVKFTGAVAGLVEERVWHESQKLAWMEGEETLFEQAPDEPETLLATFRLAELLEFKRWIKGLGEHAEILKPEWVRAELRAELLTAAKLYER